jgi:HEPN domain-containing protein
MKPPNEEFIRKVRQWFEHADEDLRLALGAMNLPGEEEPPYRLIAYHAQQCAEKYLKAFLVYHNVDFPYTHNISILLELCGDYAEWPKKLQDAEELSRYVVTTRYPGEDLVVTKEEAQEAIEIAQRVRKQIRTALKELGLKLAEG